MNNTPKISIDFVRGLQPFGEIDDQGLGDLLPLFECKTVRGGELLNVQDWPRHLVFLVKGELKLEFSNSSTQVLVGGSDDTLRPLGKWGDMPISAKAITNSELLVLDEDRLDALLMLGQLEHQKTRQEPACHEELQVEVSNIPDWRNIENMFAAQSLKNGIFTALPVAEMQELLQRFQRIKVRRGETLVRQDEEGDYYYIIETGRCTVTRQVTGSPLTLAELKAGDAFGEEALVNDTSRNATVMMKTDGVLLRLSKKDFVELLRTRLLHSVSRAEAEHRTATGAVWIDVRFAAEYQFDGIHGARNIPLNNIRDACALLDPQKEYIVYCQNGRRSAAAAFLLAQRGFRACLLEGGLMGGDGNNKEGD